MADKVLMNVCDFGARGDGTTDSTQAIHKAIDAAAESGGTVCVPTGVFLSSTLKVHSHVGLVAQPTWSYRESGGAVIRLLDAQASCLLDLTNSRGVTLNGLCLDGAGLGDGIHGVLFDKKDYGREEDTPRVERCKVSNFTGDGIRLQRIWCFSIRNCMISRNRDNGVSLRGWDGFILDNWFSGNGKAGFGAYEENSSVTMTGNRIEWNHGGGVLIYGGGHYNITGNYLDRSGGPGISLLPRGSTPCRHLSITGNLVYRSGAPQWRKLNEHESTHIRFEQVRGLAFCGNTLHAGRDDGGQGEWSPSYAMVLRGLTNSVIKDNVMHEAALSELVVDLGGHAEGVVIKDNVGSVLVPE
jgi:hypothetical protein